MRSTHQQDEKKTPAQHLQLNEAQIATVRFLERKQDTKLQTLLDEFIRLGGTIAPGISIGYAKESKSWSATEGREIKIPERAKVFPICQAGENRSQVMRLIAQEKGCNVQAPHGAEAGLDPYVTPTMTPGQLALVDNPDWDRETAYQYHPVSEEPTFLQELKQPRVARAFEAQILRELTYNDIPGISQPTPRNAKKLMQDRNVVEALRYARKRMGELYYCDQIIQLKDGKIPESHEPSCLITFNRSLHITLLRLVEEGGKLEGIDKKPLKNVIIQYINADDPIVTKSPVPFKNLLSSRTKIEAPRVNATAVATISTTSAIPRTEVPVHLREWKDLPDATKQALDMISRTPSLSLVLRPVEENHPLNDAATWWKSLTDIQRDYFITSLGPLSEMAQSIAAQDNIDAKAIAAVPRNSIFSKPVISEMKAFEEACSTLAKISEDGAFLSDFFTWRIQENIRWGDFASAQSLCNHIIRIMKNYGKDSVPVILSACKQGTALNKLIVKSFPNLEAFLDSNISENRMRNQVRK